MRGLEFGLSDTFFVAMIESIDSLQRAEVSTLHIMADHIRDNVSRVQYQSRMYGLGKLT